MASSSLSQEDFEADYETCARRTRVRTARARNVNAAASRVLDATVDHEEGTGCVPIPIGQAGIDRNIVGPEHEASPKPTASRAKDKRTRPNHINKGKQQRDRRKLREKRRSTGVVHMPSTESTGGSTGEDEDELLSLNAETKRNTLCNEVIDRENNIYNQPAADDRVPKGFALQRNKSPSDLDADDEDNQDYDSAVNQSNSNASLAQEVMAPSWFRTTNGRPQTPSSENLEELLERAREENRHLLELLENKDQKISQLEKEVSRLIRDLQASTSEHEKVKEENKALIRAMAQMAVK